MMSLQNIDEDSDLIPLMTSDDEEAISKESLPESLPILPLKNTVMFPGVVIPITASRDKSIKLIKDSNVKSKLIGVVSQKDSSIQNPGLNDIQSTGTVAKILRVLQMPDGNVTVIIQGKKRFNIEKVISEEPYINVEIETLELEEFSFLEEGQLDSLDIVYLLQTTIGRVDAVNAAIGLGGGSWVDYVNDKNQLFMTVKIQGDNSTELNEIAEAFMNWANFQTRFTKLSNDKGNWIGNLYEGETNLWIYNDGNYLRLALSNDLDFITNFLSDCSSQICNTNF